MEQASRISANRPPSSPWLAKCAPHCLSVVRVMAGLLFLEYGLSKLFGFPHVAMFDSVRPFQLFWFAAIVELVGGTLLTIGLYTRLVAFLLSGEMAIGYFVVHAPQSFFPLQNGGTAAVLFCFIFLYFVFAGPGPWSVDHRRGQGPVARGSVKVSPPPGLTRGSTNSFNLFVDGRIKSGQGG
jgi:putative oxidoreductase